MKNFFYVVVVAAVLFAAKSCKEPDVEEPIVPIEDSSGLCTVIFQNMDEFPYNVYIDNMLVKANMMGYSTHGTDTVQAGTRTLFAEQQSGHQIGDEPKRKTTVVKILTDSVYTWQFP